MTYQIKFTRAGRPMSRSEAIERVINGNFVNVIAAGEHDIPIGDMGVIVTVGSDSKADSCAYVRIPGIDRPLDAWHMHAYASIVSAASLLVADVNKILSARENADA